MPIRLLRSPRLRRFLRWLIPVYLVPCLLLVWQEPHLLYQPRPGPADPKAASAPHFRLVTVSNAKGTPLAYWENGADNHRPLLLYFHGNGGGLFFHVAALNYLDAQGFHVVALEYPGYPGVAGTPSQQQIVTEAIALFDRMTLATGRTPAIWGYSLGSGVAVQLAAARPPVALVLEAPFTSTADRASEIFPIYPVHCLMHDQYRSKEAIGSIHAPLFIMHGEADRVIPISHGEALFAAANEPKEFHRYAGFGHLDLRYSPGYGAGSAFLKAHTR